MKYIKYIIAAIASLGLASCMTPFDLDLDDEPIIFLESFPGSEEVVTFKILPAYSKSNTAVKPEFNPEIVFTVNGNVIPVRADKESYYIAEYRPSSGDKMSIQVSAEGFQSINAETAIPEAFPQMRLGYQKEDIGDRTLAVIRVTPYNDPEKYFSYGIQIFEENTYYYPEGEKAYFRRYVGDQIQDYYDMAPHSMDGMTVYLNSTPVATWRAGSESGYTEDLVMALDTYVYDGYDSYYNLFVHDGERLQYDEEGNEIGNIPYLSRSKFKLYTMTEEFYKYMVAQELIKDNADFITGLAPSNFCYSNVKGGYGVFAGVCCTETGWITPEMIESNR